MSWWKKLFGGEKTSAKSEPGGLGRVESASTILLDSGRAVRLHDAEPKFERGARVSVERLEVEGTVTFARGVTASTQPAAQRDLMAGLVPPKPPPPPSAKELEARRKEYEAGRARVRAAEREKRARWREERASLPLEALRETMQALLESRGPLVPATELLTLARPAVQVVAFEGESGPADGSRLGGQPLLPKNVAWPEKNGTPLAFLAQWKLADVPRTLAGLNLPPKGHLLFFYDAVGQPWGFEPTDRAGWQVLFVDDANATVRGFPDALSTDARFPELPLAFGPKLTIPHPFSERFPGGERSDEATDSAWELMRELEEDELGLPGHQIGGWPTLIQGDMEQECQLVSSGVRLGNENDRAATYRPGAEKGAEDWVLLFQLDSDEEGPGWMWGDCGMIYFWIRKQDLAAREFGKVWVVLQCS